jgi:alpha-galactosidase
MSDPPVLATHPQAGSVQSIRISARVAEATAAAADDESPRPVGEDRLDQGERRVGPLAVRVELARDGAAASVDLSVRNDSADELRLASAILGFRWTGCAPGSLRFLRHGWQSWSFTGSRELDDAGEPEFPSGPWFRGLHHVAGALPADRGGWHESDLVTVIGAATGGATCLVGVLERGRAFGVVYARRDGDAVAVEVELRLDAVLAPGETRELERVRVALDVDANRLLEEFAEAHGRLAGARVARPFLAGWCSWYHFFHEVTEEDVLRNLELLAAERDALPIDVVQIDDGYQRAVGDWLETNEKFPSGIAHLASEIRSAGFVPGIWTAPFVAVAESELFRRRRDWLLRSGGELLRGLIHPVWAADSSVYVLDTSREDVVDHLRRVFRELVSAGFSYHKIDFLYAAALRADSCDPRVSRAERLRRGLDAVRGGAGDEAFVLGCGCPLGAAVGVVDGMRIGPDVAPRWDPDPGFTGSGLEPTVPSTRNAVRSVLARAWMHRRYWLNDPDCLMARIEDTELSAAERRTLAATIAATGGMVIFSDDLPSLGAEGRSLVREAVEIAREVDGAGIPGCARAVGLLEGEIPRGAVAQRPEEALVALVNAGEDSVAGEVELAALGLRSVAGIPDPLLGSGALRGGGGTPLAVDLPPHDSALFRAKATFPLAVFCDFDGTFAIQDVGASLAIRHAGDLRPALWRRYERGEITAWEYNLEVLDGMPLPLAELERFLASVELDPGARDLLEWCERRGIPFRVLSDGFDFNLNLLQVIHGVRFAYDANRLRYEDGVWRVAQGHPNPACSCGTGACKRGRIDAFRAAHRGVPVVHVGNGRVSDLCGALAADVVFAKDSLAEALTQRDIRYEAFETLLDVIPRLEGLLAA